MFVLQQLFDLLTKIGVAPTENLNAIFCICMSCIQVVFALSLNIRHGTADVGTTLAGLPTNDTNHPNAVYNK